MDFINQTPLEAELIVGSLGKADDGRKLRSGLVVAKATFDVASDFRVTLSMTHPRPIHHHPVETDDGVIPSDVVPRVVPQLDAFVLGAAYAPNGRPVASMTVAVRIGEVESALLVSGDRCWVGQGDQSQMSQPEPFIRMPLTWEHAFGGGCDVWIDEATVIPVEDTVNTRGLGYDPRRLTDGMVRGFGCPVGFPRLEEELVWLPNVEDPRERITKRSDLPIPACWTAVPVEMMPLANRRTREVLRESRRGNQPADPSKIADPNEPMSSSHPDLRQPPPTGPLSFALLGARPEGPWTGYVPFLQPVADYEIADRRGSVPLLATQAVFMPEQSQITMTYQYWFKFRVNESDRRCVRLREAI